ncbi:DUF1654 domain-containing protein [Pseudomonas sp. PDM13]|uniref:DUF1654 domain-containing protein n=1 Tax=Pseudomonas sp. PDM13 TaxID=2769255 RepID=UPI0021DFBA64|nr:DUF1654 domain-containing protein [Pseudomonas sp. PDM13]MCU9949832.1 DUF1654 domain-containing protein [Pseudomonas sp. PDM13]
MDAQSLQQTTYQSYRALAQRVQALVSTPRAQIEHQIVLAREPGDMQPAWDQFLEEIRETEGVTLTPRTDGSIHIAWFVSHR